MVNESDTHFARAVELRKVGKRTRALRELRTTVELKPDFGLAWALLGDVLDELEDHKGAADAFRRAIECEPGKAINYRMLARTFIDSDEYQKAEDAARESVRLDACAVGYTLLGVALSKQDRDADAINAYEEALKLDPEFEEPMANLGSLLVDREPERARRLLERAVAIDPDFQEARDLLESIAES